MNKLSIFAVAALFAGAAHAQDFGAVGGKFTSSTDSFSGSSAVTQGTGAAFNAGKSGAYNASGGAGTVGSVQGDFYARNRTTTIDAEGTAVFGGGATFNKSGSFAANGGVQFGGGTSFGESVASGEGTSDFGGFVGGTFYNW